MGDMNQTSRVLTSIALTEPTSFGELLNALGDDKPEGKTEWREFFETLEFLERGELIEIERNNGRVETLILTNLGAERAREALKGQHNGF